MERLKALFSNLHFLAISVITLLLILIYFEWPWQEWQFSQGPMKWFSWLSILFNLALFELQNHLVGSLFLIPIVYASICFKLRGSIIVSAIAIAGMMPLLKIIWFNIPSLLTNISLLLLPAVIILLITIEWELRRKDKSILIEREKDQRVYLGKLLNTQERERQNIAEILHNEIIQTLLAVANYAEFIESECHKNLKGIGIKANWIKIQTRNTVKDLRQICIDLRPGVLDTMGLVPALKWLIEQKKNEDKTSISLNISGSELNLSKTLEETIFRIVQEALQNTIKHSKATESIISLKTEKERVILAIQDNGVGFIPPLKYADFVINGKLGIAGMYQRVRNLGGKMLIHSQPGGGTLLEIEIPNNNGLQG